MGFGFVGLYAVYLILVGVHGNGDKFINALESELKGFAPWIIAIIILGSLRKIKSIESFIGPFIGLAILSFSLIHYETIAGQVDQLAGTHLAGTKNE